MKRIGIDLGGTKIEIIKTDQNSVEPLFKKRIPTEQKKGYEHILNSLKNLALEAKGEDKEVSVGIGIPGSISPFTGKVRNANSQCLNGNTLKEDLERLLEQPVFVANDANCLAVSESIYGAGKGYDSVAAIIIGTGMGGGIVIDGQLVEGLHGNSGEWGHYSFDLEGEECWCGSRGCMELYLSGTGFERIYHEISGNKKKAHEIYQDYLQENNHACEAMASYLHYFGKGIADMIYFLDPDAIVLGGGMSNIPILYTKGAEKVRENLMGDDVQVNIFQNKMGDSSGIYGALLLPEMMQKNCN